MLSWLTTVAPARHQKYLEWCDNDQTAALKLYQLNLRISESFYIPLHTLEIILRNCIDKVISQDHSPDWLFDPKFHLEREQREQLDKAIQKLGITSRDKIISELNFGFWTSFFSKPHDQLWRKTLRRAFQTTNALQRKDVSQKINRIRKIRNRIAHLEPIIYFDLIDVHNDIIELCGQLEPTCLTWLRSTSRFTQVHPMFQIFDPLINKLTPQLKNLPSFK